MLLLKHWTGAEPHCHSHRRALACKRCIWIRQSCCLLINTLNGFSYADTCKKGSSCAVVLQDLGISKEPKFNSCPIGCAISDPAQVFIILLLHSTSPYNIFDACISCGYYYCSILTSSWLLQHRLICSSHGEMTWKLRENNYPAGNYLLQTQTGHSV